MTMPFLSDRFEAALTYAARLHTGQTRKDKRVPYIAHLLSVAALVLENGGDEDEAIAALLHDAVEDQGGTATREAIRAQFGDRVAAIIAGCTESETLPKPPWKERKIRYLNQIRQASDSVRRVSLADKVHNGRSLLQSLAQEGDSIWSWFHGGFENTLWFYRSLLQIYQQTGSDFLTNEFAQIVADLERLAPPCSNL